MTNPDGSPTFQELIGQGPPAATEDQTRHALGVPDGFKATAPSRPAQTRGEDFYSTGASGMYSPPAHKQYFQGDEYAPASQSPDMIAKIQEGLIKAGLLKKTANIHVGVWDEETKNAYKKVLEHANRKGVGMGEAFGELMASPQVDLGAKEDVREPLTIKTTNPNDLDAAYRETYFKLTGKAPTPEEARSFSAAYNGIEAQAQQQQYDLAPTGGTVVAPPDPSSQAENTIRMAHAPDVQMHQFIGEGGIADTFDSVLKKWSS